MSTQSLRRIIEADLCRYGIRERFTLWCFIRRYWFMHTPGIRFSIIFRCCQHFRYRNRPLFYIFFLWLRRLKFRYGFDISYRTKIGPGLYIGHFGGIVIHGDAVIGSNCNLSQQVTIGVLNRGGKVGVPVIGNRVFMGPGACMLGGIHIGDDVLIGAHAVVNFDVPEQSVVASPVAAVISQKGSASYVTNLAAE